MMFVVVVVVVVLVQKKKNPSFSVSFRSATRNDPNETTIKRIVYVCLSHQFCLFWRVHVLVQYSYSTTSLRRESPSRIVTSGLLEEGRKWSQNINIIDNNLFYKSPPQQEH